MKPATEREDEQNSAEAETVKEYTLQDEPIVQVFSSPANVKIMVTLIDIPQDMTASEIAESAGISRETWYTNKDDLIDAGLVEESRQAGQSTFYQPAYGNEAVEKFVELYDALRLDE